MRQAAQVVAPLYSTKRDGKLADRFHILAFVGNDGSAVGRFSTLGWTTRLPRANCIRWHLRSHVSEMRASSIEPCPCGHLLLGPVDTYCLYKLVTASATQ